MLPIFLAVALQFTPEDAKVSYDVASSLVEKCPRREAGTVDGRLASVQLLNDISAASGANVRRDSFTVATTQGERKMVNLYAEFRSIAAEDDEWIVLVSHYDTKPGVECPGANDGASTCGILAALAGRLYRQRDFPANVLLVWTDGEECREFYSDTDGLHGSRRAAERLHESGRKVKAVICLDMLGDRDLVISLPKNCSPALRRIALHAARRLGLEKSVVESPLLVKDDHVPFLEKGMPAVDLIDFEYGSAAGLNDYWHTPKDTLDKVSEESLLKSGRLVSEILNLLATPKSVARKP